jgi:putative ATP-dependent endonuclease of the OLD family
MKLVKLGVENFRSIKLIQDFNLKPYQTLIGENNAGKSNILLALDILLSAGSGGVSPADFNDPEARIVIRATFNDLNPGKRRVWKPYMINDELIIEKHIWIDSEDEKSSVKSESHGYKAEPTDWFLSIPKILEEKGSRPKWGELVAENGLPEYFLNNGACTKDDYTKGLQRFLSENEVVFDEPDISKTQALGFASKTVSNLPKFYLLKAQSNYGDEMDKRSSSSNFRKLMSDLTERIIKNDPKYTKIDEALKTISNLLNDNVEAEEDESRIEGLTAVEDRLKDLLSNLMPSVEKVKLSVVLESVSDMFSKGVELKVDDGVETDVLAKGHGLQRCVIFSLLHALILNERRQLLASDTALADNPIILAIEEPELYIHPQLGKLFYDVLMTFAETDQVIYITHSPRFIDVYNYESIAMVKKSKPDGTTVLNPDLSAFTGLGDRKVFQGLTQLNSDVNELFFAKNVILVEGPEDKIGLTETAKKLGYIQNRIEECGATVIVAGGKTSIPFFTRVLNAFNISYVVLHDLDIVSGMDPGNEATQTKRNTAIASLASGKIVNFPVDLETTLGLTSHLSDQYDALSFFSEHSNINGAMEGIIADTLNLIGVPPPVGE